MGFKDLRFSSNKYLMDENKRGSVDYGGPKLIVSTNINRPLIKNKRLNIHF